MSSIFSISEVKTILDAKSPEKQIRKAATEFEAIFIQKILAELSSTEENPFFSSQTRFWENLFFVQLGEEIAEAGGIGLKKFIVEAFKRNSG
ncbi:MAG: rod-binding protein [Desulfurobacteriaceae bacterium]